MSLADALAQPIERNKKSTSQRWVESLDEIDRIAVIDAVDSQRDTMSLHEICREWGYPLGYNQFRKWRESGEWR